MGDIKVLFDAIDQGDLEKVKSIITQQNINTKYFGGYTSLHYAVFCDKVDIVKYLISQGADTNAQRDDNTSVLHTAKFFGIDEIIKCLVDAGATVDTKQISSGKKQYDDHKKYDKRYDNKINQYDNKYYDHYNNRESHKFWDEFNKKQSEYHSWGY